MYKTCFRVSLFVIILMLPWTAIYAAGLGKLTLNSALGQPLNAEIDIVTTNSDEILSLKASIATREAFAQAGINYESVFSAFRVAIESRKNGNPYIKLTSLQAVNEPFLNILMELNWASGRILREYTVLLDPVEVNTQNIAAPDVSLAPARIAMEQDTARTSDVKKDRQGKQASKSANRSSNQTKDTYGPVNRGDTLSSIARQFLPAGVDLNQMLVALYRANREAFIASNMNLLKAGVILKIPEKSEIAAIDASTAKAEIKMQVGDWHSYQGKIAAISGESPVHANIRQSDQGKISTSIDKKATSAQGASKEVLRVSSGVQLTNKDGQPSESALTDRLRMMEEDAIARNLALQEANQRVAMLEKSIENLKQLLELKDSVLAQAQVKAESVAKTGAKPEARSVDIIHSSPEKDPTLGMDSSQVHEQKTLITQPANEIARKEVEVKPLPPQETEEPSLTDQILGNIEYVGAAVILVLLVILLVLKKRRNQLKEDTEVDELRSTDFSSAMQSRMASVVAAQAAPASGASSLFSENEKDDLAYEDIHALSETEEHDETLDDKDSAYYEEHHAQIDNAETVSEVQDENESWENDVQLRNQTTDLGLEEDLEENNSQSMDSAAEDDSSDASHVTDFDLADEMDEDKQNTATEPSLVATDDEEKVRFSDNPKNFPNDINVSDYELEIDFDDSKQLVGTVPSEDEAVKKAEDNGLEFEFSHSNIDLTEEALSKASEVPKTNERIDLADANFSASELTDEPLEFEQNQEPTKKTTKPDPIPHVPELGLADINLDIEDSSSSETKEEASDSNDKSEQWQEVETKLDLAKAYQEMDDKEGAKEMLEEVIRDGDAKQKKAAKKLLKSL